MQKECAYVIMLKIALILVKIYVLVRKKDISKLWSWVPAKHTAHASSIACTSKNVCLQNKVKRRKNVKR